MYSDREVAIAEAPPVVKTPAVAMRARVWTVMAILGRFLLAGVFVPASLPKIHSPNEFALAIYRYQLLPDGLVNAVAIITPWIELTAGFFLLFVPGFRKAALAVIGILLVVFTAAIAVAVYRGINISCGCFSVSGEGSRIGWWSLARNAALMGVVWLCWRCDHRRTDSQRRGIA